MAVKGKVREEKSFEKNVGLFEAEVMKFNPSKEEIEKLFGIPEAKEPEYLRVKDGVQLSRISIWLKDVDGKGIFPLNITLRDELRENKDKTKFQYVNSIGNTTWADSEETLPTWFTDGGHTYRKAYGGEEELYAFLRSWLGGLDLRDAESVLELDFKKLMRGNVKELVDLQNTPYAKTVVALATIRTADNSQGESTDYQQVYNRDFLPGYTMKFFRLSGSKRPKMVDKFIDRVTDPDYGCKEFYGPELAPMVTYNPAQNIARSEDTDFSEDGPDI